MYCEDSINPGKLNSTRIFKEKAFKMKKSYYMRNLVSFLCLVSFYLKLLTPNLTLRMLLIKVLGGLFVFE